MIRKITLTEYQFKMRYGGRVLYQPIIKFVLTKVVNTNYVATLIIYTISMFTNLMIKIP